MQMTNNELAYLKSEQSDCDPVDALLDHMMKFAKERKEAQYADTNIDPMLDAYAEVLSVLSVVLDLDIERGSLIDAVIYSGLCAVEGLGTGDFERAGVIEQTESNNNQLMVGMLETAIVKADDELIRCEGIGLLMLLGDLPEAEIVRRVLEKAGVQSAMPAKDAP